GAAQGGAGRAWQPRQLVDGDGAAPGAGGWGCAVGGDDVVVRHRVVGVAVAARGGCRGGGGGPGDGGGRRGVGGGFGGVGRDGDAGDTVDVADAGRGGLGGGPGSRDMADALLARCGSVWTMYGPTDTTVWSAVADVVSGDGPVPIGVP